MATHGGALRERLPSALQGGVVDGRRGWPDTGDRVDFIRAGQELDVIFYRGMKRLQQEQSNMNKEQVKGVAKDVAGKVQEQAGKLIGSKEQQIKGLSKQISGKVQKGAGDVKQAVEDFDKTLP
jgi:uncharacterized protein YjbJ (UPF0337 family)